MPLDPAVEMILSRLASRLDDAGAGRASADGRVPGVFRQRTKWGRGGFRVMLRHRGAVWYFGFFRDRAVASAAASIAADELRRGTAPQVIRETFRRWLELQRERRIDLCILLPRFDPRHAHEAIEAARQALDRRNLEACRINLEIAAEELGRAPIKRHRKPLIPRREGEPKV